MGKQDKRRARLSPAGQMLGWAVAATSLAALVYLLSLAFNASTDASLHTLGRALRAFLPYVLVLAFLLLLLYVALRVKLPTRSPKAEPSLFGHSTTLFVNEPGESEREERSARN